MFLKSWKSAKFIFSLFFNVYNENMFTIEIEDGRHKPSVFKLHLKLRRIYKWTWLKWWTEAWFVFKNFKAPKNLKMFWNFKTLHCTVYIFFKLTKFLSLEKVTRKYDVFCSFLRISSLIVSINIKSKKFEIFETSQILCETLLKVFFLKQTKPISSGMNLQIYI